MRRKKTGERKMDTFISIDGKIRDGGNPLDLSPSLFLFLYPFSVIVVSDWAAMPSSSFVQSISQLAFFCGYSCVEKNIWMAGHKVQLEIEMWIENYEGREGQTIASQRRCEAESHGGQWRKSDDESGYRCLRFLVTVGGPVTYSGMGIPVIVRRIFLWVTSTLPVW